MIKETENCDIGLALASKKNCDLEKLNMRRVVILLSFGHQIDSYLNPSSVYTKCTIVVQKKFKKRKNAQYFRNIVHFYLL